MPTSLAIVLGIAGAILIVAGIIGGGITIATTSVPTISKPMRVISSLVGACLLVASVVVFNHEVGEASGDGPVVVQPPSQAAGGVVILMNQAPPAPAEPVGTYGQGSPQTPVVAPITAPVGYDINVYWGLDTSAAIVAQLPDGYSVEIICTAEGQAVTRPDGVTSTLWDGVGVGQGVGGFVPDVYVATGTELPLMPDCAS